MKKWITFNEPLDTSVDGYGTGYHAPGLTEIGTDPYIVAHNLIRAHAKAYRMYYSDFEADQQGALPASYYVLYCTVKSRFF